LCTAGAGWRRLPLTERHDAATVGRPEVPGAFISKVIPLAVFFAFQRRLVSGVIAWVVK
jgi:hypothetical protein